MFVLCFVLGAQERKGIRIYIMNTLSSNLLPLYSFIPNDIIFDLLSYLPIKSVQRFKCVSRHWNIYHNSRFSLYMSSF